MKPEETLRYYFSGRGHCIGCDSKYGKPCDCGTGPLLAALDDIVRERTADKADLAYLRAELEASWKRNVKLEATRAEVVKERDMLQRESREMAEVAAKQFVALTQRHSEMILKNAALEHDRLALAERVREACAEYLASVGVFPGVVSAIRALDLAKLLEEP